MVENNKISVQCALPKTRKCLEDVFAYELKCRITDLTWKRYFICRSMDLFNDSYDRETKNYLKNSHIRECTIDLMDCYYHFEAFLFQAKAYLDLLAQMYPRFIVFKGTMPKKSFNRFRQWVINKSPDSFPQDVAEFIKSDTSWFNILKSYRDMLAHTQGFNPLVGMSDDGVLTLQLCTIQQYKYSDRYINEVIYIIDDGIEKLTSFTDDLFADSLLSKQT